MRLLFRNLLILTLLALAWPARAVIVSPELEVVTVANVDKNFVTVNLQNTYTTAIPICTYHLDDLSSVPSVVRIDNITANSFDVRIQKASLAVTDETPGDVHCVVSEEGEHTVGGLHWEARSKSATFTNRRGAFGDASDQVLNISGVFTTPVVLHQVISFNDTGWSTSWAYRGTGGNIVNPPIAGSIYVGKHIASDNNDITRDPETVGYIVLETASGTVNGVAFDAALGGDTIDGVDNAGNTYTAPTIDYRHGIASQNAMDGGDGGWAVLYGPTPLAGSAITVAIDEDEIADAERAHTTEQVAYWLLEPVDVAELEVQIDDGNATYLPGNTLQYTAVMTNNGPNDANNANLDVSAPADTSISGWTCAGAACPAANGSGDISETVVTFANGETLTYTIDLDVSFAHSGALDLTATASTTSVDPIATNDSATDSNTQLPDTDNDGVPDAVEIIEGTDPNDPNDWLDTDNDTVPDFVETGDGTDPNDPLSVLDTDGDGDTNYAERGGDKDADGLGDELESSITDTDGDLVPDDLDSDADGDGVADLFEGTGDADGDGIPDFLDRITGANPNGGDSDSDGINDASECPVYPTLCPDSDGDRIPNYADSDDDNDGLLTALEIGAGGGASPDDSDADLVPDYLEPNNRDTDADFIFDYLDGDDDGDGLATLDELDADNNLVGDALFPDDLDNEGIADYLDADNGDGSGTDITGSGDSDGDGLSDATECPLPPQCADSDADGIPNYMIGSGDSDGDGVPDTVEIGADPANPIDSDGDSVPDYLEDNTLDTDGDGLMNHLDADDDGDGFPTIEEIGSGGPLAPADSDGDGRPDYLSVSKVQTGLDGGAGSVGLFIWLLVLLQAAIKLFTIRRCSP